MDQTPLAHHKRTRPPSAGSHLAFNVPIGGRRKARREDETPRTFRLRTMVRCGKDARVAVSSGIRAARFGRQNKPNYAAVYGCFSDAHKTEAFIDNIPQESRTR